MSRVRLDSADVITAAVYGRVGEEGCDACASSGRGVWNKDEDCGAG